MTKVILWNDSIKKLIGSKEQVFQEILPLVQSLSCNSVLFDGDEYISDLTYKEYKLFLFLIDNIISLLDSNRIQKFYFSTNLQYKSIEVLGESLQKANLSDVLNKFELIVPIEPNLNSKLKNRVIHNLKVLRYSFPTLSISVKSNFTKDFCSSFIQNDYQQYLSILNVEHYIEFVETNLERQDRIDFYSKLKTLNQSQFLLDWYNKLIETHIDKIITYNKNQFEHIIINKLKCNHEDFYVSKGSICQLCELNDSK